LILFLLKNINIKLIAPTKQKLKKLLVKPSVQIKQKPKKWLVEQIVKKTVALKKINFKYTKYRKPLKKSGFFLN